MCLELLDQSHEGQCDLMQRMDHPYLERGRWLAGRARAIVARSAARAVVVIHHVSTSTRVFCQLHGSSLGPKNKRLPVVWEPVAFRAPLDIGWIRPIGQIGQIDRSELFHSPRNREPGTVPRYLSDVRRVTLIESFREVIENGQTEGALVCSAL